MRFGSQVLAIGTGVIYEREAKYCIVTAWHNVTGRHPETLHYLSKTNGVPDNIVVSLAVNRPEIGVIRQHITLPLADEKKSLFYIHPKNWPRVDVVAIPFDPKALNRFEYQTSTGTVQGVMSILDSGGEIYSVQRYEVPNDDLRGQWLESVDVTEELFIPGYPQNVQDYYAQPVWKRATIASSVQLGWNGERKFLVDSASKSGMSGSPVLYYSPDGVMRFRGTNYRFDQEVAILAGIYVGRLGVTKEADPQIGTVWHQSVIDEIIDSECFERLPLDMEVSRGELHKAVNDEFRTCSQGGIDNIRNPEMPSRFYVRNNVLEALQGRAVPTEVLEAVLELVENYDGPLASEEGD
jgi:hypothetical protein